MDVLSRQVFTVYKHFLTRALEGGLRITPSGGGGGHIMPPIDLSSYES